MRKILIIALFLCTYSFAFDKVSVGYGANSKDIDVYNISLQKNLEYKLLDNTNLKIEISAEYVDGKNDDLIIMSTQPLISYDINETFYIEAGLGIAYFSEEHLDEKSFGINFQFKQSIGFGYKINKDFESTLKYSHYSNADLNSKNDGIDLVMLQLVYKF